MNSFSFHLSEKGFITPLLKNNFTGYRILCWFFVSFNTLYILLYSLLACILSDEKLFSSVSKVCFILFYLFGFALASFWNFLLVFGFLKN